jgi:hypothetical protein
MTATRLSLASSTPDCLQRQEMEQFVASKVLPEGRQRHAEGCKRCGSLLRAVQLYESRKAAFVETASRVWGEAKTAASAPSPAPKKRALGAQRGHRVNP